MKIQHLLKIVRTTALLIAGVSMNGCAFGGNSASWKEEVLLHDGRTIVVERSQTDDPSAFRELGQPDPRKDEIIRFLIPGTNQEVTWKSDFGRGEQDNLSLLLLDIMGNIPYIATTPRFCHAYNKWGRPNPPYVFFKYERNIWQRIALDEFPSEFKEANVIIGGYNKHQLKEAERAAPYLSVEVVKKQNRTLTPETQYLRFISREPLTIKEAAKVGCEELIYYKGSWISPKGTFGRKYIDRITK